MKLQFPAERPAKTRTACAALILCSLVPAPLLHAQAPSPEPYQQPLDPVRDATGAPLERDIHQPLPEQYIWTAPETPVNTTDRIRYVFPAATEKIEPHFFRTTFSVAEVPSAATLYIAGPRSAEIFLNGRLVQHVESDITQPLGMHVFAIPVQDFLHRGSNTLALKVVRGRGVTGFTNSALVMQQTFGEVLLAKIIPRAPGIEAPALLISGPGWKSSTQAADGWQSSTFDDHSWRTAEALAPAESTLDLFQWNADAGLYDWPGYDGISPFLAHRRIPVAKILSVDSARSQFSGLETLTQAHLTRPTPSGDLTVKLSAANLQPQQAPSLILDFGEEITGRLELVSDFRLARARHHPVRRVLRRNAQVALPRRQSPLHPPARHRARPQDLLPLRQSRLRRRRARPPLPSPSPPTTSSTPSTTRAPSNPPTPCSIASGKSAPTPRISACRTTSGTPPSATAAAGWATPTSWAAPSKTSSTTASSWRTRSTACSAPPPSSST